MGIQQDLEHLRRVNAELEEQEKTLSSLQFVSDNSLPSVSPTSTVPEVPYCTLVTVIIFISGMVVAIIFKKVPHVSLILN